MLLKDQIILVYRLSEILSRLSVAKKEKVAHLEWDYYEFFGKKKL